MTRNTATRRRRSVRGAVAVGLAASLLLSPLSVASAASAARHSDGGGGEDLYAVLGVPTRAPTREIKSAYRRKALDTHPDKNKGVPAEEAAAAFRGVVHAFEVLSDAQSRRRYDRGGGRASSGGSQGGGNSRSGQPWRTQFSRQGPRVARMRDRVEVKTAQSRVLHVVSLEQLRTIMLDDDDRLERHLLMCFFTPALESVVTDEMLYPYPFAGMSPQHIWWEDLLQTVSVRFHRSNELTRYFNIGSGDDMTEPVFLFIKRGAELGDALHHDGAYSFAHKTNERPSFEKWMWSRVEVKVTFRNDHDHPVEIYWIDGTRANIKETLDPGALWVHYSMLTHEFYARDNRVDAWGGSPGKWKLTTNSCLGSWKIGVEGKGGSPPIQADGSMLIEIPRKECMDLSGHCGFWDGQDQCRLNPIFMREKCALTCGHCSDAREEWTCENDQTCEN